MRTYLSSLPKRKEAIKLRKIWGLIKNEYIKLFKRKFIWVSIILIAVVALGYNLIIGGMNNSDMTFYDEYTLVAQAKDELRYREEEGVFKTDSNGEYIDTSDYAVEMRMQSELWQYIIDNDIRREDWRYSSGLIDESFDYKWSYDRTKRDYDQIYGTSDMPTEAIEELEGLKSIYTRYMSLLEKNDWHDYYRSLIENEKANYGDGELSAAEQRSLDAAIWQYEYKLENEIAPGSGDWKDSVIRYVSVYKRQLASILEQEENGETVDATEKKEAEDGITLGIYRLENNVSVDVKGIIEGDSHSGGFWNAFNSSKSLLRVAGILLIIIAAGIVANEFSQGTIKFLLISPETRGKIIISKYLTVVSLGFAMLIEFFVLNFVFGLIASGAEQAFLPMIDIVDGAIKTSSPYLKMFGMYLLAGVEILVMSTIAFTISSLLRSSAVSVAFGLGSYLGGSLLVTLLYEGFELDFVRYFIFANLDFSTILTGEGMIVNQSLSSAIVIVVVHMFVFLLTAYDGFVRREV